MNILKKIIQIVFPIIFGFTVVYLLYRGTDFNLLWIGVKEANWNILSLSLGFGLLGNFIRGIRWGILLRSLNYRPKKSILIYAVVGSYAVNFVLPRAGELWRCGMLMKKGKVPLIKGIETLFLDRLADVIMVFFISLAAFSCNTGVIYQHLNYFHFSSFFCSTYFYVSLLFLIFIVIGIVSYFLKNGNKQPANRKKNLIHDFFLSFWKDLLLFWKMKGKKLIVMYSFGIWISYFLYFYFTFYAFHFTSNLGIRAGIFLFALSSIGMAVPSNGGLGPWQATIIYGLCMFRVPLEHTKVFATSVFAIQSIWVILCGLISILLLSLKKKSFF